MVASGLTLILCCRMEMNRLFERTTTVLPWPARDIVSEVGQCLEKLGSL